MCCNTLLTPFWSFLQAFPLGWHSNHLPIENSGTKLLMKIPIELLISPLSRKIWQSPRDWNQYGAGHLQILYICIYTKTGHGNLLNIGPLPPKKDQKIACSVRLYNFDIFGYSKHQDGGGFHAIPFMSNQETVSFSGAMQSKHGEVLHLATLGWLCSTFYPRPGNCAEGPQGLLGFPTHIDDY